MFGQGYALEHDAFKHVGVAMEGPRSPQEKEFPRVLEFLDKYLRKENSWSIAAEYPTALTPANMHNIKIISDQNEVLAHAVLKPLIIKTPHIIFKAGAIGSVVTADSHQGNGYSSTIIQDCLKSATEQACDIAILWTDIFDFYRKFGFELAGSEVSFVIENEFEAPMDNLRFSNTMRVAPDAIHRLYSQHSVGSVRTSEDIRKFLNIPQTTVYTAWEANGQLAAYAIEGKGIDLGGYIHEWGGASSKLMALFSYIRTQKQAPYTIICPKHSQNLIRQLSQIAPTRNYGFLGMIKITNFDGLATKIKRAFRSEGISDFVFEKHKDYYVFGVGTELMTLQKESDITQLLFGPVDYAQLNFFSEAALNKLHKILPLKFWIWGWDSI